MKNQTDRTVVRNTAYRIGEFSIRERHNERKNESYLNGDIDKSRADMNIHFRRNLFSDSSQETYEQTFNRLLAENKIVMRDLKPDAKVFDEMIFDVNSAYFENNGGYEYAKKFFAEAYKLAVKEIGGEDYILSAVLHADEKNKALSEKLGRDVYHYHLHVIYVPVVQKEILWSKRTKDKSLIGKVKEVITQISHSKKWPMRVTAEAEGRIVTRNSYSFLQDRFFEHMRAAGFDGFERGERGSTAEHLSDLEYKTKMENTRLREKRVQYRKYKEAAETVSSAVTEKQQASASLDSAITEKKNAIVELDSEISGKKKSAAVIDKQMEAKKKELSNLKKKIAAEEHEYASVGKIENLNIKRTMFGAVQLSEEDWKMVSDMAKQGVKAVWSLREYVDAYRKELDKHKEKVEMLEGKVERYEYKEKYHAAYYEARKRSPNRLDEVISDILRRPPEQQAQQQNRAKSKTREDER